MSSLLVGFFCWSAGCETTERPRYHVTCAVMDDKWASEIGRRIERARRRAKLSRPELADVLEVHTNTITGYERGDRAAYKAVGRIAEATNSDLRWLLFGESYQDPLLYLAARVAAIEKMLSTVPGAGAPPELPVELGRFAEVAEPNGRKAPSRKTQVGPAPS